MPDSIFSKMSKLCHQYNAINLAQGFPDFDCDKRLKKLVYNYMQKGHNQYAPLTGVAKLRSKIADKIEQFYDYSIDSNTQVTITAGATEGLFSSIQALVHRGDEVIVIEPSYDSYIPAIKMAGGVPVIYNLPTDNFTIDWDDISKYITDKTKMIIINNPNNPTAKIMSKRDMKKLEKLVVNNGLWLLSDEVYEHIIFDNKKHQSALKFSDLRERTIAVYSYGKLLHVTGWKLGYVIAPEAVTKEIRKVHQHVVFSVSTPMQYAIADYLDTQDVYKDLRKQFQKKKDLFLELMSNTPFDFMETEGSYFVIARYDKISPLPDMQFAIKLIKDYGVGTIPVSGFYNKPTETNMLRFCFAKKDATLEKAALSLNRL